MLKRKLCQKCWNKGHKISGEIYGWSDYEEGHWNKGWIYCPEEYREKEEQWPIKIIDNPPNNCPFLLEHILTQED